MEEKPTNISNNNKIEWIIILRAFACLAVIIIHITSCFNNGTNTSMARIAFNNVWVQPLIRFAVPCFMMITGSLLLDPKKNVNISKIKKYIKRMLIVLLIFGLFYCIIENIYKGTYKNPFELLFHSFINLLEGKSWDHMWYIYTLIGLYVVTPVLRIIINNTDRVATRFILTTLFFFTMFVPTINTIFKIDITTFGLEHLKYIFIYLIGYYIVHTNIIKTQAIYVGGIIGIIGYILCCYHGLLGIQDGMFIVLETMALVKIFSSGILKINNNSVINTISEYSFGIYLVHAFWLNLLYKGLNFYPYNLPFFIGEFLFFAYALILSVITCKLIYKIPIIRKML